jgi:hypothetical protein
MLVLIAVALAVVMGTSYVSSAAIKAAGTRNLLKAARARYLAESGMQHAMYVLWTDPSSLDGTSLNNPLGPFSADSTSAQYRLWSTPDPYEIGLYHVTARATSEGLTQDVLWDVYRTPPYEEVMLANDPKGYWRFTDGEPDWYARDSSDEEHGLFCLNGAAMTATSGVTSGGSALALDGVNDYATRWPTPDLQIKTDLTVSVWFNMDQLPSGTDRAVLVTCGEEGELPGANTLYELAVNSSGQLEYLHEFGFGQDQAHVFDTVNFSTGSWHNVVVTRDWATSVIKVYVEGRLVDSWTFFSSGAPRWWEGWRAGLDVGSAWGEESFFDGKIDELGLMNHVMSDQMVQTLYEAGGTPEKIELRSIVR